MILARHFLRLFCDAQIPFSHLPPNTLQVVPAMNRAVSIPQHGIHLNRVIEKSNAYGIRIR